MTFLSSFFNNCCTSRRKAEEPKKTDDFEDWEKVENELDTDTTTDQECFNLFKQKKVETKVAVYKREYKDFYVYLLKYHIEKIYEKKLSTNLRRKIILDKRKQVPKLIFSDIKSSLDYNSDNEQFADRKEKRNFVVKHFEKLEKKYYGK